MPPSAEVDPSRPPRPPFEPPAVEAFFRGPSVSIDPDPGKSWLRRMSPVLFAHKRDLMIGLAGALIGLVLQMVIPRVVMEAVDRALIAQQASLGFFVWLLLGMAAGRAAAAFVYRYRLFRVAYLIEFDLRALIFEHINRLSQGFFDRVQSGQLISRSNSDIRSVQMFLVFGPFVLVTLVSFLVALGLMLSVHASLTVVCLLPLPLVFLAAYRMRRVVLPAFWIAQDRLAQVATIVEENVSGTQVVKSFAAEAHQIRLLGRAAERLRWAAVLLNDMRARYAPIIENLPRLATAAVLLYGGHLTIQGETTVGALVAFSAYVILLQMPFRLFGMLIMMSERSAASAGRIFEILDARPEVFDRPGAVDLVDPQGEIAFDRVAFSYGEGPEVLSEVSFRLAPGESAVVVGATASGKTTLVKLLTRMYDVGRGSITIDGHDIRDLSVASLRAAFGVVDDEALLFSTSIRDNIAFGRPDASLEQVERAARAAAADAFIAALPEGYDTLVGERGSKLSGGERQRVALARTLAVSPRVLILDDATSSVDVETEKRIHGSLRALMGGRTVLIIAHRLSTVALADRVLFLDEGRIAARGSHRELFDTVPRYREVLARAEAIYTRRPRFEARPSVPPSAQGEGLFDPLERAFKGMG